MTPLLTETATAAFVAAAAVVTLAGIALRRRFAVVLIAGPSMLPTFRPGDRVIIRRVGCWSPQRDQVVVFEWPREGRWQAGRLPRPGERQWMIKRVTAIAGDPVPRDVARLVNAGEGARVPGGQLVVIGDGQDSMDSRIFGYVSADRVLGVVVRAISAGRPPGASQRLRAISRPQTRPPQPG